MTAITKASDWTREQIETIKQTVAKGANDAQLALFLQTCRSRNLDPFTRQVFYTPQGIIVSIDGFRAIAERTGCYAPGPTRYEYDENKALVAAYVTVRKLVAGTWFDVEESAFYEEYRGSSPIWKSKPRVMLAKCAESRALRRAFSSDLSGVYSAEELDQAQRDERPVEVTVLPAVDAGRDYSIAAEAIRNATDLDALKTVATMIQGAKSRMTADEVASLKAAYAARKSELS
jgi:phage recombination protein Bet